MGLELEGRVAAVTGAGDMALEWLARGQQTRVESDPESLAHVPGELIVKLEGSLRPRDLPELRAVLEQSANGRSCGCRCRYRLGLSV